MLDLWVLIAPLVSSNSSYIYKYNAITLSTHKIINTIQFIMLTKNNNKKHTIVIILECSMPGKQNKCNIYLAE